MPARAGKFAHLLERLGAVPLPREALDEVLEGYRRPNVKISEWLKEGALLHLRRGLPACHCWPITSTVGTCRWPIQDRPEPGRER